MVTIKKTVTPDLRWWEQESHPDDHDAIMEFGNGCYMPGNLVGEYRFELDGTYANIFDHGHISWCCKWRNLYAGLKYE